MLVKVGELTGAALNWAVAKCTYGDVKTANGLPMFIINFGYVLHHTHKNAWRLSHASLFNPSADWSQGGPIIEQERISIILMTGLGKPFYKARVGLETDTTESIEKFGPAPLIAAMRCYVASKMSDEIEILEELLQC